MNIIYLKDGGLKFQHTSSMNLAYRIVCLITVLWLYGCGFPFIWGDPGFIIDIEVQKVKAMDLKALREFIINQGYRPISFSENQQLEQYQKIIEIEGFSRHPYVELSIHYDFFDKSKEFTILSNFNISIRNIWEGQRINIKNEINRMGNLVYVELVNLVGKDSIIFKSRSSGPPW